MSTSGGQPGNNNAGKNKPWKAAIDRALNRRSLAAQRDELDKLADQFLTFLDSGEQWAWKEFADRMDGKPSQVIAGDPDAPLYIQRIEMAIIDK